MMGQDFRLLLVEPQAKQIAGCTTVQRLFFGVEDSFIGKSFNIGTYVLHASFDRLTFSWDALLYFICTTGTQICLVYSSVADPE